MNSSIHFIIQYVILLLSLVAGIIAWFAKLKWSREFSAAKDAQISSLKEMVDFYKNIISSNLINFQKEEITVLGQLLERQAKIIQIKDEEIQENEKKIKLYDLELRPLLKDQESRIKEQFETLSEYSANLAQANELLVQRQQLIDCQVTKLKETNEELGKHITSLELKNTTLENKIQQYEGSIEKSNMIRTKSTNKNK